LSLMMEAKGVYQGSIEGGCGSGCGRGRRYRCSSVVNSWASGQDYLCFLQRLETVLNDEHEEAGGSDRLGTVGDGLR
jgi:hypothetical protein